MQLPQQGYLWGGPAEAWKLAELLDGMLWLHVDQEGHACLKRRLWLGVEVIWR